MLIHELPIPSFSFFDIARCCAKLSSTEKNPEILARMSSMTGDTQHFLSQSRQENSKSKKKIESFLTKVSSNKCLPIIVVDASLLFDGYHVANSL